MKSKKREDFSDKEIKLIGQGHTPISYNGKQIPSKIAKKQISGPITTNLEYPPKKKNELDFTYDDKEGIFRPTNFATTKKHSVLDNAEPRLADAIKKQYPDLFQEQIELATNKIKGTFKNWFSSKESSVNTRPSTTKETFSDAFEEISEVEMRNAKTPQGMYQIDKSTIYQTDDYTHIVTAQEAIDNRLQQTNNKLSNRCPTNHTIKKPKKGPTPPILTFSNQRDQKERKQHTKIRTIDELREEHIAQMPLGLKIQYYCSLPKQRSVLIKEALTKKQADRLKQTKSNTYKQQAKKNTPTFPPNRLLRGS